MELSNIKAAFPTIIKIAFEKEHGQLFLRVTTNLHTLEAITKLTKSLTNYLDQHEATLPSNYYLDVSSAGTDYDIDDKDLDQYLEQSLAVYYQVHEQKQRLYGQLIAHDQKQIVLKYNCKGQMRKITIDRKQILVVRYEAQI